MDYTLSSAGKIVYLYRIVEGQTGGSHALQICEMENLDPKLIARMQQIMVSLKASTEFPAKVPQSYLHKRYEDGLQTLNNELGILKYVNES